MPGPQTGPNRVEAISTQQLGSGTGKIQRSIHTLDVQHDDMLSTALLGQGASHAQPIRQQSQVLPVHPPGQWVAFSLEGWTGTLC